MSDCEHYGHHGVHDTSDGHYPNETIRLLLERASCRSFEDKEIPDDILDYVLKAGIHAPTGGNLQPFSIIKITDKDVSKKLGEKCEQSFIGAAPVNLLFCLDFHRLKRWAEIETAPFSACDSFRHFWIGFQDTIIAAQNICTAADALGLGSVYIGTVLEFLRDLKEMFDLPQGVVPVVLLCLGYPKHRPKPRKKLPVDIIVHNEKYQELTDKQISHVFKEKYSGWKWEINEERLARIEQVCRDVHGEEFARKCIAEIKENGYISPVQVYFGLHYVANEMNQGNAEFLKIMREFGFGWFDK